MAEEEDLTPVLPYLGERERLRERDRFGRARGTEHVAEISRFAYFRSEKVVYLPRHSQTVICVHIVVPESESNAMGWLEHHAVPTPIPTL